MLEGIRKENKYGLEFRNIEVRKPSVNDLILFSMQISYSIFLNLVRVCKILQYETLSENDGYTYGCRYYCRPEACSNGSTSSDTALPAPATNTSKTFARRNALAR